MAHSSKSDWPSQGGEDPLSGSGQKRPVPVPAVTDDGDTTRDDASANRLGKAAKPRAGEQYRMACFTCRAARQRCDRRLPCSRCTSQGLTCRFPTRSNRGRKEGSTNKPETAEKLLSRINESSVRDEVIAALLKSAAAQQPGNGSLDLQGNHAVPGFTAQEDVSSDETDILDTSQTQCPCLKLKRESPVVSPLQIMAGAFATAMSPAHQCAESQSHVPCAPPIPQESNANTVDNRLVEYFSPRTTYQKDWHVLASQSINCTLKLETTAIDPIAARLADQDDVALYFKLFFQIRNPLVGMLDPDLHTPEYVYDSSFTLFSVICALGCAISTRPRDQILYPTLISLAEANVLWSIAASVKSLEIIQAIINIKYWAPIHSRQADDPYWLHISHAGQLARELGINRPPAVTAQVETLTVNATPEFKERMLRNFERTWLYVFVADKSFGIITGRSPNVAWKELPSCPCSWWRKPMTTSTDRMVSGIIDMRVQMLEGLGQLDRTKKTLSAITQLHTQIYNALEKTRNNRCRVDEVPELSVLAFYMDHSIMVFNAQVLRDLMALDDAGTSEELKSVCRQAFDVAKRTLDIVLSDPVMQDLRLGWHNNQFIMVAHAMTEVIHAIRRGNVTPSDVTEATSKMKAVSKYLEQMARELPASSAAHIYASLSTVFCAQLDRIISPTSERGGHPPFTGGPNTAPPDWLIAPNEGSDPFTWFDMGFLCGDQTNFGSGDLNGLEELGSSVFPWGPYSSA